jgi:DNA-binding transcriptional LysR family regulator
MLDLAQVRCFVVAATELNFRRAAALLNMTQPPLSRQIHLLEHKLGVQLFERVGPHGAADHRRPGVPGRCPRLLQLSEQAEHGAPRQPGQDRAGAGGLHRRGRL